MVDLRYVVGEARLRGMDGKMEKNVEQIRRHHVNTPAELKLIPPLFLKTRVAQRSRDAHLFL